MKINNNIRGNRRTRGVTLVEIAIVLVIIGLLLGGILKGQELINNAKIRAIADRQNSLKVAWFSFLDRFQAMPGDYVFAQQYIPGSGARQPGAGDGLIKSNESPIAFQMLTGAGYLRCPQCTETIEVEPTAANSLQNSYGGVMSIWSDGEHYAARGGAGGRQRLMIHTGPRIPSNIISEVDRKIDDGIANSGDFVFNNYDPVPAGQQPEGGQCMSPEGGGSGDINAAAVQHWRYATETPPVVQNCGGSVNI